MESRLTILRKKSRAMWTQDDYDFVQSMAKKYDVVYKWRANCSNCYEDFFMRVCIADAEHRQKLLLKNTKRQYFLRAGLRAIWRGRKVNEGNSNDKAIKRLLDEGFPRRFIFTRDELLKKYGFENQ